MSIPYIRIANAPCSWGVLEFDLSGKALGYAQVLDEIKASQNGFNPHWAEVFHYAEWSHSHCPP